MPLGDDRVEQARRRSARALTHLFVVAGASVVAVGVAAVSLPGDEAVGVLLGGVALTLLGALGVWDTSRRRPADGPIGMVMRTRYAIAAWGSVALGLFLTALGLFR